MAEVGHRGPTGVGPGGRTASLLPPEHTELCARYPSPPGGRAPFCHQRCVWKRPTHRAPGTIVQGKARVDMLAKYPSSQTTTSITNEFVVLKAGTWSSKSSLFIDCRHTPPLSRRILLIAKGYTALGLVMSRKSGL